MYAVRIYRALPTYQEEGSMLRRKLLLVLGLTMLGGTVAELAAAATHICIPCTAYCKKHPNADRCN
jgi:hypothetical protein